MSARATTIKRSECEEEKKKNTPSKRSEAVINARQFFVCFFFFTRFLIYAEWLWRAHLTNAFGHPTALACETNLSEKLNWIFCRPVLFCWWNETKNGQRFQWAINRYWAIEPSCSICMSSAHDRILITRLPLLSQLNHKIIWNEPIIILLLLLLLIVMVESSHERGHFV